MTKVIRATGLADRIAEAIDDYVEANPTTPEQALDALVYVYGTLERYCDNTPARKLH